MASEGEAAVEAALMSADAEAAEVPRDSTPSPSMKSGSVGSKGSARGPDMKASSSDLRQPSDQDDTDSELSDGENFLTKGAFLLTPSNELNMEKASAICEKMNFRGPYSLTKTATGILFKFAEMDDYQATFKKGFHKVTGARFYKKVGGLLVLKIGFRVFVWYLYFYHGLRPVNGNIYAIYAIEDE